MTRHPALHGARDFVTLARVADLVGDDGILDAYGAAFDADDNATLLIAAPDAGDAEIAALEVRLDAAGLTGERAPDMLLVPYADLDELEPHADAVLGRAGTLTDAPTPRYDGASVPLLARRYEQARGAAGGLFGNAAPGDLRQALEELLCSPDRVQELRVARFAALSTCRTVIGEPKREQPLLCVGPGRIEFGADVQLGWPSAPGFYSGYTYIEAGRDESVVRIGDRCMFNNTVALRSEGPGIDIGPDTLLGNDVQVFDSDFHEVHPARRHGGTPRAAEVRLGRNVWIGSNAIVLCGVTIGDDTVVGAGSIVTRSLPAGVIAAGNPARVVRAIEDAPPA